MKNLIWHGPKVKRTVEKAASEGLFDGINYMRDEMDKIVPHDEGTLMRSGETKVNGLKGATGYDTPYAIRLHEHPEYNFQDGRKGKWVEKTIKDPAVQNKVLKHIGNKIKQSLG